MVLHQESASPLPRNSFAPRENTSGRAISQTYKAAEVSDGRLGEDQTSAMATVGWLTGFRGKITQGSL